MLFRRVFRDSSEFQVVSTLQGSYPRGSLTSKGITTNHLKQRLIICPLLSTIRLGECSRRSAQYELQPSKEQNDMRLTRLEIFGFKSFVERFTLHFDKNLIGIVGPNGCGKSNVVDALRWVLGETHAKQLRGGKQEDLIFNGSEAKRPLGMAEVSITIRPDEHWAQHAFTQQDELERLLIEEETRVGEESIVDVESSADRGHSEDGAQPTPEPNLTIAEQKSEKKQDIVGHSFLSELPGLLNASEIQFTRRLYRSGESEYMINRVPCRLRDMVEIYRYIGLGSRGLNIVQQGQIGELISKKPIERRELLEEAAGISGFRSKLEAAQRKLTKTSENLSRIKDIELEVDKQVKVLKRQATRAKMRNELKEELEQIELEWFGLRTSAIAARRAKASEELASLTELHSATSVALSEAEAQFIESQSQLETHDQRMFELRRQRDQWAGKLRAERERIQSLEKELVRCETERDSIEGQREHLAERETKILDELQRKTADKGVLETEVVTFQDSHREAERALQACREQVAREVQEIESLMAQRLLEGQESLAVGSIDQLQAEIQDIEQRLSGLSGLESQQQEVRKRVGQVRSQIQTVAVKIASLQAERATIEKQARAVAEHVERATSAEQAGQTLATLAAKIIVPSELQAALHAALGDKGSFVVSPSAVELGRQYLSRSTGEKKACIGVIDAQPRLKNGATSLSAEELVSAPSARLLLSCVEVLPEVKGALEALLQGVVVVDSLEEAFALQSSAENSRELVVTLAGEAVTPWGWFTTSGVRADFSFGRRIEELSRQILEVEASHAELETALDSVQNEERQIIADLENKNALRQQTSELRKKINELLQTERREREALQQEIRREERRLRDLAYERERQASSEVQRVAQELSRRSSQFAFIEERLYVMNSELADIESLRVQLVDRESELEQKAEEHRQLLESPSGELDNAAQLVLELDTELDEVEKTRSQVSLGHGELAQTLSEKRRAAEAVQRQVNQAELAVERTGLELQVLIEEATNAYAEKAEEIVSEWTSEEKVLSAVESLQERIDSLREESLKLRKRLEREGEVDPDSIQRFEEESARLLILQEQAADLQQAVALLERTIKRLKELSRERFLQTYQDVSRRFAELIPRLFGGGAGHMELIDPEDPLMSGVEISVRPPGKKLSSMELLSGGEKALVATAVLVAMFLHRPSPICVLDEVDAPLDEANLDRFISLVSEISSSTQFLVITHNKATMAEMGRLVGITMQERGVSTALSVTLDEAEEELDRWIANA
jgi:chromosome segregation protein